MWACEIWIIRKRERTREARRVTIRGILMGAREGGVEGS